MPVFILVMKTLFFLLLCIKRHSQERSIAPDVLLHVFQAFLGAVVAVIVWLFDLEPPVQSMLISTDVVSSNLDQGEVYNIM
jgi:Na+/serine symporter